MLAEPYESYHKIVGMSLIFLANELVIYLSRTHYIPDSQLRVTLSIRMINLEPSEIVGVVIFLLLCNNFCI